MGFYDLSKLEREKKYQDIQNDILRCLQQGEFTLTTVYFDDADTYVRKAAYLGTGRLYKMNLLPSVDIVRMLDTLIQSDSERIRQTVINAAGEIAMTDFPPVER